MVSTGSTGLGWNASRAILSALCASLIGIGLARFAYTPLIPALIGAGWTSPAEAAYLGAANMAGYLAGALAGRDGAAGLSARGQIRLMMLVATASFFACAAPAPFAWYLVWRFLAGLSGGVLMVLAAPTVLPLIPTARAGLASGVIFTGVGAGIAISGSVTPLLLRAGLGPAWVGLGVLALALTAIGWGGWPSGPAVPASGSAPPRAAVSGGAGADAPGLNRFYLVYGLNAVALVPAMLFLVDHVARGLGHGLATGATIWVLFGLGAMAGPLLAGHLADAIGFARAFRFALLLEVAGLLALAVGSPPLWVIAAASLAVGALVPGTVPLALGRVRELVSGDGSRRQQAWSRATTAFAIGQVLAAYGLSLLFAHGIGHGVLFAAGAGAALLNLLIDRPSPGASLPETAHVRPD